RAGSPPTKVATPHSLRNAANLRFDGVAAHPLVSHADTKRCSPVESAALPEPCPCPIPPDLAGYDVQRQAIEPGKKICRCSAHGDTAQRFPLGLDWVDEAVDEVDEAVDSFAEAVDGMRSRGRRGRRSRRWHGSKGSTRSAKPSTASRKPSTAWGQGVDGIDEALDWMGYAPEGNDKPEDKGEK
ncbi:MAG: hypothetical protein ABI134_26015, partial [Byssovorax sp.]